jgi:hypothetical protein
VVVCKWQVDETSTKMSVKRASPLMRAASFGDEELVRCLLDWGADINYASVGD